jgi:DNA repair ATPase RecN
VISGNDLPRYTQLQLEKDLMPFVLMKFGKCSPATFSGSSFYLADWNKAVQNYFEISKHHEILLEKQKKQTLFNNEPRDLKTVQKIMTDLQKQADEGDIKLTAVQFKEFLNKFFNPEEKNLVSAVDLKNLSEKLASSLIAQQTAKKRLEVVKNLSKSWNRTIQKINDFQQLCKSIDENSKKLAAALQKLDNIASRMRTTARNIDPEIEKLLLQFMKNAKAPNWKITPDTVSAKETASLSDAILKKITYEPIFDSDGE